MVLALSKEDLSDDGSDLEALKDMELIILYYYCIYIFITNFIN
jgi:hypothetical protein